jgi:hypothetical protein
MAVGVRHTRFPGLRRVDIFVSIRRLSVGLLLTELLRIGRLDEPRPEFQIGMAHERCVWSLFIRVDS